MTVIFLVIIYYGEVNILNSQGVDDVAKYYPD